MRKMIGRMALSFLLLLSVFGGRGLHAESRPRLAVLPPENRSGDPRYDYLGAIVHGLLLYDLSSVVTIELVDRGALDAILRERELSLSAAAADPVGTFQGILPADYLAVGEYLLVGTELRLTLKLVETAGGRLRTYTEAGSTENLVHALAERVLEALTGTRPSLREEGRSRSILSLRDETPGSIALHSPLIDAEILMDGAFVGYTTGDRRKPFIIEGIAPGPHELSTDLGRDFGVVGLPEVSFGPWKETVNVQSGKRAVVTDKSTHFNDVLYRLKRILAKSSTVVFDAAGSYAAEYPFSFVDRGGTDRRGRIAVTLKAPARSGDGRGDLTGTAEFEYEGQIRRLELRAAKDSSSTAEETIGLVDFSVEVEDRYGRVSIDIEAERNDVDQGMHRGE